MESEEHECPYCHRQQVAIDHINPNLFLRKYVNRWYEDRQQTSFYPYFSLPQQTSTKTFASANTQNLDNIDEFDVAILPTSAQLSSVPVKTAPIVIRMQPTGHNLSPPRTTIVTKPADMTFEDGKATESDSTTPRLVFFTRIRTKSIRIFVLVKKRLILNHRIQMMLKVT